ncbi:MAG TPA: DUF736 family protein [Terriglobia bacterium]|nr:DUF736 family protein [Terriglobia bacterium]
MTAIGTLTPTRDGGWAGPSLIMANTVKIKLVPNDNQANPKAPAFRVFAGDAELGAAWQQRTNENAPREFLSVNLDFPGLQEPISAAIFFSEDGTKGRAVWNRKRKDAHDDS